MKKNSLLAALFAALSIPVLAFATIGYSQTITFNALSNKLTTDADFSVSAVASSHLVVAFASLTPATCTVTGTTVDVLAAGTCTVEASQAGGSGFNSAAPVSQSFTISAPAPVSSGGGGGNGPIVGGLFGMGGSIVPLFGQVLGVSTSTVTVQATSTATSTAATSTLPVVHLISQKMCVGSRVPEVKELQIILGLAKENQTGYFGTTTEAAVKAVQGLHGYEQTGCTGPKTLFAVNHYLIFQLAQGNTFDGAKEIFHTIPVFEKECSAIQSLRTWPAGCKESIYEKRMQLKTVSNMIKTSYLLDSTACKAKKTEDAVTSRKEVLLYRSLEQAIINTYAKNNVTPTTKDVILSEKKTPATTCTTQVTVPSLHF